MLMQMSSTQMLAILTNLTILARVIYQPNNALSSPVWPCSSVVRASVKEENPGIVGLNPTKVKKLYLPPVENISLLGQCSKKTTEFISLSCITSAAQHNILTIRKYLCKVAYCLVGYSYLLKNLYLEHGTPQSLKNLSAALLSP